MNFLIGAVISVIFVILKFIEMTYIAKEEIPVKYMIRDAFIVYFSTLIGNFAVSRLTPIVNSPEEKFVFTGNPEF